MGVNIFKFESSLINAIRMMSIIPIILMIFIKFENYKISEPALFLATISTIGALRNGISLNIVYIILFISTFRSIPFLTLTKLSSQVLGLAIAASLAFVAFGITENVVDVSTSFMEDSAAQRERFTFGYRNVNAFTALVSSYCMLIMLQGNNAVARYLFAGSISCAFYLYTDSRTLIASTALFFFLSFFFNLSSRFPKTLLAVSTLLAISPLAYSILSSTILNHMPMLDLFLSNRLSLGSSYIEGFTPLEKIIGGAAPSDELTIDNAVLLVIGAIGVPATFYLLFKITQALKYCIANHDHRLYAFILSSWLLSVSESSLVRPESIICLSFWLAVIFTSPIRGQCASTTN